MQRRFTLNYCQDGGWCAGKLNEVPGVFSQGDTLEELEVNIADAYQLVMEEARQSRETQPPPTRFRIIKI